VVRVVLDTNIYISALNFGGTPEQVLTLARKGRMELFISAPILNEIERVLRRKFKWPMNRIGEASALLKEFATIVEPVERVSAIAKDEPDNRVLECAAAAKANVIVSGDSHLRELGNFRGIRILSPRAFLDTTMN
jgi:putative PIN family toxin of toxin-antitoxin system